jgi:hypothetical protein
VRIVVDIRLGIFDQLTVRIRRRHVEERQQGFDPVLRFLAHLHHQVRARTCYHFHCREDFLWRHFERKVVAGARVVLVLVRLFFFHCFGREWRALALRMAIFDWSTPQQATIYTRAASRRHLAAGAMHMLGGERVHRWAFVAPKRQCEIRQKIQCPWKGGWRERRACLNCATSIA